ncbi:hypothetical protein WA158_007637 [Blastocystis sp. Blastoise]
MDNNQTLRQLQKRITIYIYPNIYSNARRSSRISLINQRDHDSFLATETGKRKNTKIPDSEKQRLMDLWSIHGVRWTPEDYSLQLDIKLDIVKRYVRKLVNNTPLIKERRKSGRHAIITPNMSKKLKNMFIINPKLTLNDAVLVLSDTSTNSIFERVTETYDVPEDVRIQAEEELKSLKESNTTSFCSKATVAKHLHSSRMAEHVGASFNVKKLYKRGQNSNNDDNKTRRIEVYNEIDNMIHEGKRIIYLDEVHWSFNNFSQYGWGKVGEKIYYHHLSKRLSLTAIATISNTGAGYTELFSNSVTGAVFGNFLRAALTHYTEDDMNICLYMDNAPVHQKGLINDICNEFEIPVIYGPPYSPDMNPIENVFSIWKGNAERNITRWNGIDDFIQRISDEWKSIDSGTIRKCISRVMTEIRARVFSRLDI